MLMQSIAFVLASTILSGCFDICRANFFFFLSHLLGQPSDWSVYTPSSSWQTSGINDSNDDLEGHCFLYHCIKIPISISIFSFFFLSCSLTSRLFLGCEANTLSLSLYWAMNIETNSWNELLCTAENDNINLRINCLNVEKCTHSEWKKWMLHTDTPQQPNVTK